MVVRGFRVVKEGKKKRNPVGSRFLYSKEGCYSITVPYMRSSARFQ